MHMVVLLLVVVVGRLVLLWFSALISIAGFGFDTVVEFWRAGVWEMIGVTVVAWILYMVLLGVSGAIVCAFRRRR